MINVVDRIPTKPNEFELEDLGGGRVKLTRADEPSEAGTPINRELFRSIANDLAEDLIRFTQTQPTITKDAAPHVTTIWLSDDHTQKWNSINITQTDSGSGYGLTSFGVTFENINLELECYQMGSRSRYYIYDMDVINGIGTINHNTVVSVSGGDDIYISIKIIFDGYKVIIEQSYSNGGLSTANGGFYDVRILCKGRVE